MTASTPDQTIKLFAQHLNEGDLDAAVALYEPDATFLPDPATVVSGTDAIRPALAGFFAIRPTLDGDIQRVVVAGDTALVVNDWKLSGTLPDGSPVHQSGRSADVLRRQPDGRWLLIIDDPWG
jgi:uncharacterized protein (TIGR02246 family)